MKILCFALAFVLAGGSSVAQQQQAPPESMQKIAFHDTIGADRMAVLRGWAGLTTDHAWRDKNKDVKDLLKLVIPDCEFHYGRDMPLKDALDMALRGSKEPVQVVDDRYVILSGAQGPYLKGRAMLWFDMTEGIGIGAFYFQPTNGEPTPSLSAFSRQVSEAVVTTEQMPDAFLNSLIAWQRAESIPPVSTRYFLTGAKKRILFEHDEDYCQRGDGSSASPGDQCEQTMAYAADVDEVAAYYLQQIHNATNGTAWMIGPDQRNWIAYRDTSCGAVFGCRIRLTREHVRLLVGVPRRRR